MFSVTAKKQKTKNNNNKKTIGRNFSQAESALPAELQAQFLQ